MLVEKRELSSYKKTNMEKIGQRRAAKICLGNMTDGDKRVLVARHLSLNCVVMDIMTPLDVDGFISKIEPVNGINTWIELLVSDWDRVRSGFVPRPYNMFSVSITE